MKRAKIALRAVVIGGIVAFLLSYPSSRLRYHIEFKNTSTITYDEVIPNKTITMSPYAPQIMTEKAHLAINSK